MGKSYSNMSRADLEKLARSQAGQLGAVKRSAANGKASGNGQVVAKLPVKVRYLNVAQYPCASIFTAEMSSKKIVRHWRGECGCRFAGSQCHAVRDGLVKREEFGTRPDAVVPETFTEVLTYVK